jgi:hypothetical protein
MLWWGPSEARAALVASQFDLQFILAPGTDIYCLPITVLGPLFACQEVPDRFISIKWQRWIGKETTFDVHPVQRVP